MHSLSKRSNLAGARAGFYAGDPDLVHYLCEVRKHAGFMVPGPVQAAAVSRSATIPTSTSSARSTAAPVPAGHHAGRPGCRVPPARRRLLPVGARPGRGCVGPGQAPGRRSRGGDLTRRVLRAQGLGPRADRRRPARRPVGVGRGAAGGQRGMSPMRAPPRTEHTDSGGRIRLRSEGAAVEAGGTQPRPGSHSAGSSPDWRWRPRASTARWSPSARSTAPRSPGCWR